MRRRGFSPYGPSKAALESETIIWSQDLAGTGVTVNALLPGGATLTGMIPSAFPESLRAKLLDPSIIVPPLLWLVSRDADAVTGRRLVASRWRADLDSAEAAAKASEGRLAVGGEGTLFDSARFRNLEPGSGYDRRGIAPWRRAMPRSGSENDAGSGDGGALFLAKNRIIDHGRGGRGVGGRGGGMGKGGGREGRGGRGGGREGGGGGRGGRVKGVGDGRGSRWASPSATQLWNLTQR